MTGKEYARLLAHDQNEAHRALFDEYYKYVYTVVCSKLSGSVSREDIEECVSDVFAEVFFELEGGHYGGELKGIISTIAKRRAIDRFRRAAAKGLQFVSIEDDDIDSIKAENDIETDAEKAQAAALLLDRIEALGEPDSTIIIGKYYYGKSSRQLAAELSMKSSAVRMRCQRALKRLRHELEEAGLYGI